MHVPLVVDADGHCQEPEEGLAQWMPKEQVSFTCEAGEPEIPHVLDAIGESQVMYASDYAHWDSEFPESVKMVAGTPGLSEARLKLVLGRNAIRWFNLKESDLLGESVYFGRGAPATA